MSAPNYSNIIDIDDKFEQVKQFFSQYSDPKSQSFVRKLDSITTPYLKLHVIFQAVFFVPGFKLADTIPAEDFTNKYLKPCGMLVNGCFLLEWTAERYIQLMLYTLNYHFHKNIPH